MNKHDLWLSGGILLLALLCLGGYYLLHRHSGDVVEIRIDGTLYQTLSLQTDTTIEIPSQGGHRNQLTIKDGYADMTSADCPDKLCVHQKKIAKNGETLVCLPNKVIVSVQSDDNAEIDGVAK